MDQQRRHILCVAFPAFGHMIPMLSLARRISQYHNVTFAVSRGQHDELRRREILTDNDSDNHRIKLFGIEDGFFGDMEDPTNAPLMEEIFKKIGAGNEKLMSEIPTPKEPSGSAFDNSGQRGPVDVVIADNMIGGAVALVKSRGPLFFLFHTASAAEHLLLINIKDDHPECEDDDASPKAYYNARTLSHSDQAYTAIQSVLAFHTIIICFASPFVTIPKPGEPLVPIAKVFKPMMISIRQSILLADGIIMNSVREAEEEAVTATENRPEMANIPIYCVGPLMPQVEETHVKHQTTENKMAEWLAGKREGSVIYVSFGSVAQPSQEQLKEIAEALKNLDQPFIWSLKAKHHEHLPEEFQKTITGNLEDVNNKHLIVPWVPQKLLLAHPSVGVFISHCGWNSTLEGLANGKPFVAWPQFGDQLINAEILEEKGAAVVIRDAGMKKARLVKAEEIVEAVKKAGTQCASAAKMWGEKIQSANEPGHASYEEFVKLMRKYSEL